MEDEQQVKRSRWHAVGTGLAVASGGAFFFLCMILSLVGPAGSRSVQAQANRALFLGMLLVTFALAAGAAGVKLTYREAGAPRPYGSFALCALCGVILIVLLAGGFAI